VLKNKKIVIVGGSSGIGYAVAERAISAGAHVVIASRSEEKLKAAVLKLGMRASMEIVDVANEQSVIDFALRIGKIDHLITTIKPQLPSGSFVENDIAAVKNAFDAKFWGQYLLAKSFAEHINLNGSITFTSGIASQRSYHGYSAVTAMNAATEALSKAIAKELAPIRVNTVCPGFVDTIPPTPGRNEYVKHLAPNLPLNRLGVAHEIAGTYLYLLCSTYSTGSIVVVDGGAVC
jgi:NAD(P)-dependent dehydrogenase (short-subunit alcohol dehydrogenase family)